MKAKDTQGRVVATVDLNVSLACLGAAAELFQTPTPRPLVVAATGGTVCPTCKVQGEAADSSVERAGHMHTDNNSSAAQRDAESGNHLAQTPGRVALTPQAARRLNDQMGGDLRDQQEEHNFGVVVAAAGRIRCSTDGVGIRDKAALALHRENERESGGGASELSGNGTWVCEFDPRDGNLKEVTPSAAASTSLTDASATSAVVVRLPPNDTPAVAACRVADGSQSTSDHSNANAAVAPGAAKDAPPAVSGTPNLMAGSLGVTNCTGEDASRSEIITSNNAIGTDGALAGEAVPSTPDGVGGRSTLLKAAQRQGEEGVTLLIGDGASLEPALAAAAAATMEEVEPATNGEGNTGLEGSNEERRGRDVEGVQEMPEHVRMMVVDRGGEQLTRSPSATVRTSDERPAMEGNVIRIKTGAEVYDAKAAEHAFPGAYEVRGVLEGAAVIIVVLPGRRKVITRPCEYTKLYRVSLCDRFRESRYLFDFLTPWNTWHCHKSMYCIILL